MLFDNRLLHLTSQTMIIDLIQMRELHSVEADKVNLSDFDEIIDVRSPSEYEEDNLPNALNMPVLNDEERKLVGTAYKQQSPFVARRKGASIVAHNISKHLKDHFFNKEKTYSPLIYCWRGGQRSRSLGLILSEIGWRTQILDGGYKSYRRLIVNNLYKKPGCSMYFRKTNPGNFLGTIEPGCKCYIKYGKDKTYVKSKVTVNENILISEDSGYEIETGKKIWGSEFGPLIFKKIVNFNCFIDENWK
mgnify:CR=1 FL=1